MPNPSNPECAGELSNAVQEGYQIAVQEAVDRMFANHEATREAAEAEQTALAAAAGAEEIAGWQAGQAEQAAEPTMEDVMLADSMAWFEKTAAWRRAARREIKRGDEIQVPHTERSEDRQKAKAEAEAKDEPFHPHEVKAARYIPGQGKLISRAVAIEQDHRAAEDAMTVTRRPLLTKRQSEAIHQDWDGYEEVANRVVNAMVIVEFATSEEHQKLMTKAARATARFEVARFQAEEEPQPAESTEAGEHLMLDVTELRQYRELKDRRSRAFEYRQRGGYGVNEAMLQAA